MAKRNKLFISGKFALCVVTLFAIQGCSEPVAIKPRKPLTVSTIKIKHPVNNQFRNFKGSVMPADLTPLSFRVAGELSEILVHEGQKVDKGQLLARLESDKYRQKLADAQAQFDLALKQQSRGRDLLTRKMVSQSEYDELTANRRLMEVNYQAAKNNVKYTDLIAPFAGYVSSVDKKSFESTGVAEKVLTIYRDDVVRIRLIISDTVIALINPDNQTRTYQVKTSFSGDDRSFTSRYYQHSSEPSAGSNAFEFWLEMPQVSPPILPGTSANLDVDLVSAGLGVIKGYQVPMTALDAGRKAGDFYIWKLVDGKVHRHSVEIIQMNNQGAVIASGVKTDDVIVNSSLRKLREDAVVVVADREE
jgi:RND family efflux transporter MFP subunit